MWCATIFDKWDVPCAEIGRVTDDGMMRVRNNGAIAAEIPAKPLADEAPLYSREAESPLQPQAADRGFLTKPSPTIDNRRSAASTAARSDDRFEELGLSPIRSHGAHRHGR